MAANSKVVFGGETLIDLTSDTVNADTLADGVTAHNAAGASITGTGSLGAVRYDTAQALTDTQKAQARENIGAGGEVMFVGASAPVNTKLFWIDSQNSYCLKFYNESTGQWQNIASVWS